VAIIYVCKAAHLVSVFLSQRLKRKLQLDVARVEEWRLLVRRLVAAQHLLISSEFVVLQMVSILVTHFEKKLVVGHA